MKKRSVVKWMVPLAIFSVCWAAGGQKEEAKSGTSGWGMKLRVLEGVKQASLESPSVVTSSYLRHTLSGSFESNKELVQEQSQIKRIFNLKDVKLLTEADLNWKAGLPEKVAYVFWLDGREYSVRVSGGDLKAASAQAKAPIQRFSLEVLEMTGQEKKSLLATDFTIPTTKNVAVFGFEDSQGKPYYISLRQQSGGLVSGGVEGDVLGGIEGGVADAQEEEFAKGAVKAEGEIKPPKLIKQIAPVYPEAARKERIEGIVILSARADAQGNISAVRVLRSIPELNQAAIDALKQWKYEPVMINGKPSPIVFTVTVNFKLKHDEKKTGEVSTTSGDIDLKRLEEFAKGSVLLGERGKPPRLLTQVGPVYPEKARKEGVEGTVILAAKTDEKGNVVSVLVLRSIPGLDDAATAAVKQWKYEPFLINGQPSPVVFTITVKFQLK